MEDFFRESYICNTVDILYVMSEKDLISALYARSTFLLALNGILTVFLRMVPSWLRKAEAS